MSTTAQRTITKLAQSINQVFCTAIAVSAPRVVAELVEARGAVGFSGTGLRLTIGNRTMVVDESGGVVSVHDDGKEVDLRTLLRNPPEFANPKPRQTKPGDFSDVDWSGSGRR